MERQTKWLLAERYENWLVDQDEGFRILGFPERMRVRVAQISKGDKIVVYLASRKSAIGGIHECLSEKPYWDIELVWDEIYPVRIEIRPELILREDQFVPVRELIGDLSFTRNLKDWRQCFRTPIRRLDDNDYGLIRDAINRKLAQADSH